VTEYFSGVLSPPVPPQARARQQSPNQLCHAHRTIEQLLEKIILSFFQAVLADLAKPFGVVLLLQGRLLGNDRPRHVIDFPHYPTLRITQDWGITTIEWGPSPGRWGAAESPGPDFRRFAL